MNLFKLLIFSCLLTFSFTSRASSNPDYELSRAIYNKLTEQEQILYHAYNTYYNNLKVKFKLKTVIPPLLLFYIEPDSKTYRLGRTACSGDKVPIWVGVSIEHLIQSDPTVVMETIRHELGHVKQCEVYGLSDPSKHHGEEWLEFATIYGSDGKATARLNKPLKSMQ